MTARGVPYLSALDGIRALAVVAVLLYHADLRWFPGGFLGVEVFFVLSGYLITALLWSEFRAHGRIEMKRFWARRARRLLPAAFAMLGVVAVAFVVWWPEEVARVRGDLASALGYVSNWYLVGADHSYFSQLGRPSPFGHLWSLAIEEQFYLVWPLMLGGLAFALRRVRWVALAIVGLAGFSGAIMWLTLVVAEPSRAYYGTDARAAGLLAGAALAIVWRPWERSRAVPSWILDATIAASIGYLVWTFMRYDSSAGFTFRPGLHLVDAATLALIAACVHRGARLSAVLGTRPLRALGRRSYSIYLWHWPVFVVLRPDIDLTAPAWVTQALRVAVTLVLAEVSYRFIELPARAGGLGRLLRRHARPHGALRPTAYGWGAVATSALLLIAVAASVTTAPVVVSALERDGVEHVVIEPKPRRAQHQRPERAESRVTSRSHADVVSIGDSVMLGARKAMANSIRRVYLDASVALPVHKGLDLLRRLRRHHKLAPVVVVHLGNNGTFSRSQFDDMMHILRDAERVVVVNVKVPRRWEHAVNQTIREGARRHRTKMVDWHSRWRECNGRVFESDGYHLTRRGAGCYARMIADVARGRRR